MRSNPFLVGTLKQFDDEDDTSHDNHDTQNHNFHPHPPSSKRSTPYSQWHTVIKFSMHQHNHDQNHCHHPHPPPPHHHHHHDLYCNVMHRWCRFAAKLMSFVHHAWTLPLLIHYNARYYTTQHCKMLHFKRHWTTLQDKALEQSWGGGLRKSIKSRFLE